MSEHDLKSLEAELRRMRPARAPGPFVNRLQCAVRNSSFQTAPAQARDADRASDSIWQACLRLLLPVGSAAIILAVLLLTRKTSEPSASDVASSAAAQAIDEVELDQQLVAAFEGVAQLPGGPPLRFRCYSWQEELTFRDANGALEVEQRQPRLDVVPVGFDVY